MCFFCCQAHRPHSLSTFTIQLLLTMYHITSFLTTTSGNESKRKSASNLRDALLIYTLFALDFPTAYTMLAASPPQMMTMPTIIITIALNDI